MGYPIPANIGPINTHKGLGFPNIPSNQVLVPTARVDEMLVFRVTVEFCTVDSVSMAVMRGVRLLELNSFFAFDLIVNPDDWFAASR
jgi:hypothetical protein